VLTAPDGKVVKGIWAKGNYLAPYSDSQPGVARPAEPGTGGRQQGAIKGDSKKED
jgi:hypothetical protein